jgi:quercetin dioxygenase-like cupin family protein
MLDTPPLYLTGAFVTGALHGRVHVFNKGEGLPVHVHTEERNHITVVLHGRFRLSGRPAIEGKIMYAGEVLDWMPHERHGFEALEDGSSFLQVQK